MKRFARTFVHWGTATVLALVAFTFGFTAVFAQDTGETQTPNALIDMLKNLPNVVLYVGVVAAALPWLIAATVRPAWSSTLKVVTTYAWCLLATAIYFVVDGSFDQVLVSRDFISLALWVFAGSQIFYRLYGDAPKETEKAIRG